MSTGSVAFPVDFPAELLDAIFEWVHAGDYHKRTIFACSLVSSRWEALSRRQRFRTVSLSIDDDPAETMDFLRWDAFAASPIFPRVVSSIRKLTLSFTKTARGSMHSGFLRILPLIPGLRELELRGSFEQRIAVDPESTPADATKGIARLFLVGYVNRGNQRDPRALCDLLSLFPSLSELDLARVNLVYPKPGQTTYDWTQWKLPAPKALALRDVHVADVLHGTRLSSHVQSLKSDADRLAHHGPLVRKLEPTLEDLDISAAAAPANLSKFPALRSLTLRGDYGSAQWDQVASSLASLPRTSPLNSFKFFVNISSSTSTLDALHAFVAPEKPLIRDIEAVLFRLATEGDLRSVEFVVQRGLVEFISAPSLFATGFPRLVGLGLLQRCLHNKTTSRFVPL